MVEDEIRMTTVGAVLNLFVIRLIRLLKRISQKLRRLSVLLDVSRQDKIDKINREGNEKPRLKIFSLGFFVSIQFYYNVN